MTEKQSFKLISLVLREQEEYENEMLGKDSEYLFENAREIYARKFVGDCLSDYEFIKDKDYKLFPKENIVCFITNFYLYGHDEINEHDLSFMFDYYEDELKEALQAKNPEM